MVWSNSVPYKTMWSPQSVVHVHSERWNARCSFRQSRKYPRGGIEGGRPGTDDGKLHSSCSLVQLEFGATVGASAEVDEAGRVDWTKE